MGVLKNLTEEYFEKIERLEDMREFIDFGGETTVLWSKYSLEIDGKSEFYFDEVKDFNKGGWRLPTIKEVKQIFNLKSRASSWMEGYTIIKFTKGIELKIKTDGLDGFIMWTKDKDDRFNVPIVWTYGFDNMCKFYIKTYNTSFNTAYVLLVKDKRKK